MPRDRRAVAFWVALGSLGFSLVPWYATPESLGSVAWLTHWGSKDHGAAWVQALWHGRGWLWPVAVLLGVGWRLVPMGRTRWRANGLCALGALGFVYTLGQGFVVVQPGIGIGATLCLAAFAGLLALGLAARGAFKGDGFVAGSVVGIALLVALFTFFPVVKILLSAFQGADGSASLAAFGQRLLTEKIWGLGCLGGGTRCGVAWNTLLLAVSCAVLCTALGLAF